MSLTRNYNTGLNLRMYLFETGFRHLAICCPNGTGIDEVILAAGVDHDQRRPVVSLSRSTRSDLIDSGQDWPCFAQRVMLHRHSG
jgi:hypothetical protein